MSQWMVKHAVKVIIGVTVFLVTALLSGMGYVAWYAIKVPRLESKLAKHDDKLATISANLIVLMNRSGKPLDSKEIKKLLSHVEDMGDAKARLITNAEVIEGSGIIQLFEWVPSDQKKRLTVSLHKGQTIQDKKQIAVFLSAATVADKGTKWIIDGNRLVASRGDSRVAFTAAKKLSSEELEKWAVELNFLSAGTAEIKKPDASKQQ